ncbi:MAG: methionyl-tRNA synthetase [Piccolia ochrophora]|nr:MAG: methionyl-tRNA synthetase [Piccolia ochrophora]
MVIADIIKRWQTLQGREAILCTGTDEHGMKIQQAADAAGIDPKPFCDRGAEVFKMLAEQGGISYDHFVRTTSPEHRDAVEYVWHLLQERGHIYASKHEGWYSVSDETFYPQSGVHLTLDPRTGRKGMTSIETGSSVEWTSESNYHFRLSDFRDKLLAFYQSNEDFVLPSSRRDWVIQSVKDGLEDLSISRPVERLSWGIRVPNDDTQTIYVWLDALVNYLTKSGFPWTPGQEASGGWPADCHVIGKDIVRFHCIYWPAFLLALDVPPPRQILTHAHWTLGRRKMAKSTGNVVNPFFALDRFGTETMRFYLAHDGGLDHDSDYGNEQIVERYKHCLQGALGNLASRIVRGKGWDVRASVRDAASERPTHPASGAQKERVIRLHLSFQEHMDCLRISKAVRDIIATIDETNKYLQLTSPWVSVNSGSAEQKLLVPDIIYTCGESLRISGILLQPFMPGKAAMLLDMLGVADDRRGFSWARLGADLSYGTSTIELGRGHQGSLFPPPRSIE